jgi:homoserine dehydrogenase
MQSPLNLAIAGLGTVGAGVVQLLQRHGTKIEAVAGRPVRIAAVSARDTRKPRPFKREGLEWVDDPLKLAAMPGIDVFLELMGGEGDPSKKAVESALKSGKHVVTANKALLAHHGTRLAAFAEKHKRALNFEAAVAGGIPIVKTMREALVGNDITRVYGILNGTSNFILTMMQEEGRSFADALAEAQRLGYAEADPTFDVGGFDAAHKLALLTSLAFGTEVSFKDVYVEGIAGIRQADIEAAEDLGYRIKLLGVALRTEHGIEQRVHPAMLPALTAIAEVDGVTNCVAVNGDAVRDILLVGPGAGAGPTASAIVSDVVDIARGLVLPPFVRPASKLSPYKPAGIKAHEGAYYVRLSVFDRPGAFASIAIRMAREGVSLESIVQRRPRTALPGIGARGAPGEKVPVIMITHPTRESAIRKAVDGIEREGNVDEKPQVIRIETL